jgi:hypothetical protein
MRDIENIAYAISRLAAAITPANAIPFKGPLGHQVGSLTEAIIYAADTIADSINRLEFMVEEVRDAIAELNPPADD